MSSDDDRRRENRIYQNLDQLSNEQLQKLAKDEAEKLPKPSYTPNAPEKMDNAQNLREKMEYGRQALKEINTEITKRQETQQLQEHQDEFNNKAKDDLHQAIEKRQKEIENKLQQSREQKEKEPRER